MAKEFCSQLFFPSNGKYTDMDLVHGDFMFQRSKQLWWLMDVFKNAVLARKITQGLPPAPYSLWLYIISTIFYFWFQLVQSIIKNITGRDLERSCSPTSTPGQDLFFLHWSWKMSDLFLKTVYEGQGVTIIVVSSRAPKSLLWSSSKCLIWIFLVAIKQITASPWLQGGDKYLCFCKSLIHLQIWESEIAQLFL